jgi:hypothetical protein
MMNTNPQFGVAALNYPGDLGNIVNALNGTIVMQGGLISAVYNSAGRIRQSTNGGGLSSIFEADTIVENVPGVAISSLVAPCCLVAAQTAVANGAACTLAATQNGAVIPVLSECTYGTSNSGTMAVTLFQNYSAVANINSGVTVTTRVGYRVEDVINFNQTFLYTSGAGTTTNQYGIDIPILTAAATVNTAIRIGAGGQTLVATTSPQIDFWKGTTTIGSAFSGNVTLSPLINAGGTLVLQISGYAFGLVTLFQNNMTVKNTSGTAANITGVVGFAHLPTFTADTQTITGGTQTGFNSAPTYNVVNGGSLGSIVHRGYVSGGVVTGAGVTSWTHFLITNVNPTAGGTMTTQIGVDIPAISGSTGLGIRNAAALAQQGALIATNNTVTVAANAGTVSGATYLSTFTNSSAAAMTITMPAGGTDGQIIMVRVYDFSAVAQTITWVNTENSGTAGSLTPPTTSNGSTTLPKMVWFMFNAATTKWRVILST